MKPLREVNEERDGKYPAFRRWDVSKWEKWRFYAGAVTLMPLRIIMCIVIVLSCYIFIRLFTIGHRFGPEDKPMTGWFRNLVCGYTYKIHCAVLVFVLGVGT